MSHSIKSNLTTAAFFAYSDTKARYSRSLLGPFWLVLGTLIGVVGLGFIWSELLGIDKQVFIPKLSLGFIVWYLISGVISESAGLYMRYSTTIKNIKTELWRLNAELVFRHLINFFHNALVVILVFIVFKIGADSGMFLALIGLVGVVVILFFLSIIISLLGARYKDLEPLVGAVMPILFFLSPVIMSGRESLTGGYFKYNPITYLIEPIRAPIVGGHMFAQEWLAMTSIGLFAFFACKRLYSDKSSQVPYWI